MHRKGKELRNEAMRHAVTGRLVALTGALSWPFTLGCKAYLAPWTRRLLKQMVIHAILS